MRYSGIQPHYFPRLHYFARILNADLFMFRDDAQFVKKHKFPDGKTGKSHQADTPVKQSFGLQYMAVPIKGQKDRFSPIFKTLIAYDLDWVKKHLLTIKISYSKSKNFTKLFPSLEKILNKKYNNLADLNIATTLWALLILFEKDVTSKNLTVEYINKILKRQNKFRLRKIMNAVNTQVFKSFSNFGANQKILALCKEVGANEDYCGGTAIASYFDHKIFDTAGIKITVQDWECRNYEQLYVRKSGFIKNLSIIDLLLNVDAPQAGTILSA